MFITANFPIYFCVRLGGGVEGGIGWGKGKGKVEGRPVITIVIIRKQGVVL